MTPSKRKPATAPATVTNPKEPVAPAPRSNAPAPASDTATQPGASAARPRAAKAPQKEGLKEKRIRASFTLPESQIVLLGELKKRCLAFGVDVKKGELLTAGLQLLKYLPETALEASILPAIRPDREPAIAKKRRKE